MTPLILLYINLYRSIFMYLSEFSLSFISIGLQGSQLSKELVISHSYIPQRLPSNPLGIYARRPINQRSKGDYNACLPTCLYSCLSLSACLYLPTFLSVCLPLVFYLPVCLSASVCLPVSACLRSCICLPASACSPSCICLPLLFYLPVCLSAYVPLSACLPFLVHLPVSA